jgi:hypothetical protein
MRDIDPGQGAPAANPPSESFLKKLRLELLAGLSIMKEDVGAALALRGRLAEKWLLEWGGILPHSVSDLAEDSKRFAAGPDTAQTSATVDSFGETHWSLLYRIYSKPKWTVTGGAGLSLGFITNRIDTVVTDSLGTFLYSTNQKPHRTRIGPRVQLGVQSPLTSHLSLGLHIAWVYYANEETRGGLAHDLDFDGFLIEPMVQWRF